MNSQSPPRLATWLLRWWIPTKEREAILGDLAEEFALRISSPGSCQAWYWGQTLRSIPPIAWQTARQGRWMRTLLVALGAYIAAGLVEFVAAGALLRTVDPNSGLHSFLSVIIGLATMAAGGNAAARLRPGAETVMSAIIFFVVVGLFAARVGDTPLWYGLTFLIAGPLAPLAGGALWPRSKR